MSRFFKSQVGSRSNSHITYSYKYFDGTYPQKIHTKIGQTIIFSYKSEVVKGTLQMQVMDPENIMVSEFDSNTEAIKEIVAEKTGNYILNILGTETEGSFSVSWKIN
jgi:hypothetical protein